MDIIEAIKTRRSNRKWKNQDIPDNIINQLIEVALYSPSAFNKQPWEFILIRDDLIKRALAEPKEEKRRHFSYAPVLLGCCIDTQKSPYFYKENGAIVAHSIILAAHSLGLSSCYIAAYDSDAPSFEENVYKILKLPLYIKPVCFIALGYSSEMPKKKELRNKEELIHREIW